MREYALVLMFLLSIPLTTLAPKENVKVGTTNNFKTGVISVGPKITVQALEAAREAQKRLERIQALTDYLNGYGSPLAPYACDFIDAGATYGVDYRIPVAISGKEQTFGVAWPGSSNNFWGYGGFRWPDISTAIWEYTRHLSIDYPDLCQGDVWAAASYAESETWEAGVNEFYQELLGACP